MTDLNRILNVSSYRSMLGAVMYLFLNSPALAAGAELHAAEILRELADTRAAILAGGAPANSTFVTVWDFDGTILDGDCTDDLVRNGQEIYPGLVRLAVEAGLSNVYPPGGGIDTFWKQYAEMDETIGHWLSYPFIIQSFRGARAEALSTLTAAAFNEQLSHSYYASSMAVIRGLEKTGVESWVISASPERFVRGAAATLSIDESRIHGIRVVENAGRLTEQLIYPVTWSHGKRERLQELVSERQANAPVFVIGGFGNSYDTDGPFLEWIARQQLPAGQPVVLMINGGAPPANYADLFRHVKQEAVVGR